MNSTTGLWIGLASVIFSSVLVLVGSLGSQIINAISNLKAKRLELVYARKADAYKDLMEAAGTFSTDYSNREKFSQFNHSYYAATLVASESVLNSFSEKGSLVLIGEKLHLVTTDPKELFIEWNAALQPVVQAMRHDLQRFARH